MINNLKKVISSAAALAIVATSASAFAANFPDVDQSASYAGAVDTLTALGIVEGDDNGKFNPDNSVTRAEFAKMVVEARGEGNIAESQTTVSFTDSQNHWAAGYIAVGVTDGFINGYDDTTFGPDDTVTYAQAVKMLVAAIGYESYAATIGGWPTGYLSYGNSLNITDGVAGTIGNDTALTRAQCAILINNALKAPLVENGDLEFGGLTGTIPMQSTVQMNGQGKNWQTLLTRKHNAYVVKGRVVNTSRTLTTLDDNQVQYKIESADNFEDEYITKSEPITQEAYVGSTNAANMLFTYSEAIIQKDKNTDEYTLISISQYGANKTEEFKADLVSDEESYGKALITNGKMPVYKSESSSAVTTYKLASSSVYNTEKNAQLYVNGVAVETTDANIEKYVLNNATGTVTLIDETSTGSTSTDGYYEYILVDYYVDAIVDSVTESSSNTRVYFKNSDNNINGSRLQWDPEDDAVSVKILKGDAEIKAADLAENDVLSIAYDVNSGNFSDSEFYEILVSQNVVTGTVTSRDTEEGIIKIDGNEYQGSNYIEGDIKAGQIDLSTEYTLYLDVFGYIAHYEEGVSTQNYAIVVGMYTTAGEDYATVRLVTTDGSIKTYVCKDADEENNFFTVFNGKNPADAKSLMTYDGKSYTKTNIPVDGDGDYAVYNNVCSYTTTSSGIKFKEYLAPKGEKGMEFKSSTNKLGSYTLSETATAIVDVDGYLNSGDNAAAAMSLSTFENEAEYDAYVYGDRNSDGSYRFVVVTGGVSSINPDTAIAVVQSNPQQTTKDDGNTYSSVLVSRDGAEDVEVLFEDENVALSEGDIIVYTLQSDGTVADYNLIFSAYSSYDDLASTTFAKDNFAAMLNVGAKGAFLTDEDMAVNKWFKSTDSKPAKAYFGPIYQKLTNGLEVFVSQDGGKSNISSNVVDFAVDSNTKSYIYDYSARTGKGERVYTGALSSSSSNIYNGAYTDGDKTTVDWATVESEGLTPNFAFVKVVDGDVTEVVYFVAA